jgi:hypothetical protein
MNLTVPVYKSMSEDHWLPLLFGGWVDKNYNDKKNFGASSKGIFDCTCFKKGFDGLGGIKIWA